MTVDETDPVELTVTVADTDLPEQTMTFALGPGAPAGATIDSVSGEFTWTPDEADGPGVFPVEVIVTDDVGLAVATQFTIHVREVNSLPILDGVGDFTVNEKESITFTATATDADVPAQRMVFGLGSGAPTGASIDPFLGHFHWKPGEGHGPGEYTFEIYVLDEMGGRAARDITIHVLDINEPPVLVVPSHLTVDENETTAFTATATDADLPAQAVTFSLGPAAPADALIDPTTGEFAWTPSETDGGGDFTFQVFATDADGAFDSADVTIYVADVNEPPVLTCPAEAGVDEGGIGDVHRDGDRR